MQKNTHDFGKFPKYERYRNPRVSKQNVNSCRKFVG
jgi:hypothetical protein